MIYPYPTDLDKLQSIVWEQNDRNGWHESYDFRSPEQRAISIATQLALIHTEVSEATQILRSPPGESPDREAFGRELADIIMRTLDLAETLDVDITRHIHQNLKRNQARGYKHGGKRL